ncbi:nucleotidyltransferase family protein [Hyphomicrobiales bacterium]|nr:nucleotidyltransferase family protein [Hyphomicrobiales bacterium]
MEQSLSRIACFILAAGMSKRMGPENKLLKKYKNNVILNQTLKNHFESKLKILNIVIGHDKESIKKNLRDFNIQIIENLNYMSGMLTSIKEINNHIDENITGIMISLADMPLVSSEDINSIIDAFLLHNEEKICIPESKGRFGNPMIIPVGIYKKIIQNKNLLKDKGLKSTILDGKFDIIRINTSNGVLKDFDTQEDFN